MKTIVSILFFAIFSVSYAGFKINNINSESVYKKLNLQSGDEIEEINQNTVNNLSDMMNYFEDISKIKEIKILRNGQSILIKPSFNTNMLDEMSGLLNEARAIKAKNSNGTTTYTLSTPAKKKGIHKKLKLTGKTIEVKNKNEIEEFDLENVDQLVDEKL
ncbi:MAG: site-2 protease family protein [Bacteriovoracaceae bacterium]|nr:site-2 protease family protein [Bacteriovoracaceae bacterium]